MQRAFRFAAKRAANKIYCQNIQRSSKLDLSSSSWLGQSQRGSTNDNNNNSKHHSMSTEKTKSCSSVKHQKASHKFTLDLGKNQTARIDYRNIGPKKIEMYHTEVPEELRGRGIGKALAKGALECAGSNDMKVKVTCEYLINFVNKHAEPKHKKLVVEK